MSEALVPQGYLPRVTDTRLEKLLKAFGGVEVTGPKWCGKTWLALAHAKSWDTLMDEATLDAAFTDARLVLDGDEPHLVDEWQEVPAIWDAARNRIDANANRKGQFILTGSTRPKDTSKVRHSGTGRIARLRIRTMSLHETGEGAGGVSLARLFEGEFEPRRVKTEVADVARWCCRGGWPSIIGLDDEFALETPGEYVKSIAEVSAPKLGYQSDTTLRLLRALAMNVAQAPTAHTLAADMGEDDSEVSRATVARYLGLLRDLFVVDDLPGWAPPLRSKKRVRTKPKPYFVDPSIPASLIGATPASLLHDTQTLGNLFETMVMRDLRTYMSVFPGAANRMGYYRDDKGLEADVVLELSDGRWGAIEVKLSEAKVTDEAAARLKAVARKLTTNPAERTPEPSFLAFVTGAGERAYRRSDGVYIIPLASLEP